MLRSQNPSRGKVGRGGGHDEAHVVSERTHTGGQFESVLMIFASNGAGRSAYEETDWHQLEEDRFAAETAELLRKRALSNDFESLIIVAPPKTLGELRKHYHKEVEKRLAGEVAKDLTGHPVVEIEKILQSE